MKENSWMDETVEETAPPPAEEVENDLSEAGEREEQAKAGQEIPIAQPPPTEADDEADDDWADFAAAAPPAEAFGAFEDAFPDKIEDKDWASDWVSAQPSQPLQSGEEEELTFDDEEEDFAFTQAPPAASVSEKPFDSHPLLPGVEEETQLQWSEVFSTEDLPSSHLQHDFLWILLQDNSWLFSTEQATQESQEATEAILWQDVREIEESLALKYHWSESADVYQSFLGSLEMDLKLAKLKGRRPDLPAFAAHLGSVSLTPDHPLPPHPIDVPSLSVPPVQFDWRDSGLTNPLSSGESVKTSSAILDLDFFTTNDTTKSALENDLEKFGLQSTSPHKKWTKQDPLQSLLRQSAGNDRHRPELVSAESLSEDAKKLLDSLPNFDFMLSSVLMFPIRQMDEN